MKIITTDQNSNYSDYQVKTYVLTVFRIFNFKCAIFCE